MKETIMNYSNLCWIFHVPENLPKQTKQPWMKFSQIAYSFTHCCFDYVSNKQKSKGIIQRGNVKLSSFNPVCEWVFRYVLRFPSGFAGYNWKRQKDSNEKINEWQQEKQKIKKKWTEKEKQSEKRKMKQDEKYANVLKQIFVNGLKDPG